MRPLYNFLSKPKIRRPLVEVSMLDMTAKSKHTILMFGGLLGLELWAAIVGWKSLLSAEKPFQNSSTKKDNIIFLKSLCCLCVMPTEKRTSQEKSEFCHVTL